MKINTVKQMAWLFPIGLTFTDQVGSCLKIDGDSMAPACQPGDYVLVEKLSVKWMHSYTRGDAAILWSPNKPHQQLIKRVVALEGDTVWDHAAEKSQKIPQGRCWVEGDNRGHSGDSATMYGPVHLGLLEGRVLSVVYPPWRWSLVRRQTLDARLLPDIESAAALASAAAEAALPASASKPAPDAD